MPGDDLALSGTLFSPVFVARELPVLLARSRPRGGTGDGTGDGWARVKAGLLALAGTVGPTRVLRHAVAPLADALGFQPPRRSAPVETRDGAEDGGYLLAAPEGPGLRVWPVEAGRPLDSGAKRGASPVRAAFRVLRVCGETMGLVLNGHELRLLLHDPNGGEGQAIAALAGRSGWAAHASPPPSFVTLSALASPAGIVAAAGIFEAAHAHQAAAAKSLRAQTRAAIADFAGQVLDHPANRGQNPDPGLIWRQALTIVYRLLFVLKMESATGPGQGFGFANAAAWRRDLSPGRALAPLVRRLLDLEHDTGRMLEQGLRLLFGVLRDGLSHADFSIAPLGGGLFDPAATACLDGLVWGERAVALLLDRLLWTAPGAGERDRVHYGFLDVEELGHVYESLLDLEPAGEGPFQLRAGSRRRTGGSYYTPRAFVGFLVRETLSPLTARAVDAADPAAILRVKVFDPAMGSGHFLVESCRFLAAALYEACQRCDAIATPEARARVDALPDPDRRLAAYLPARCHGGAAPGPARERALAICRRLVAVHCLYGVDRDPMAVELAKLSIWLESFAEGLPLTFLDHRLLQGDSIAAPFFDQMCRLPVGGGELDPLLAGEVVARLDAARAAVAAEIRTLDGDIGASLAEIAAKEAARARLDAALAPLRALARAWSGAVATGAREANDAWLGLAHAVAETGAPPDRPHAHQARLLAKGADALPLDLIFPDVFAHGGFDAVLGNPPWDVVHYQTREFLAPFDPAILAAPTKRERDAIERRLLEDPAIAAEFDQYRAGFAERKRLCDRLFPRAGPTGSIDLFQIFAQRMMDCMGPEGALGFVVPSSLLANEGTAGLRTEMLTRTRLETCFTFENRRKLFDIHASLKFSAIVARRPGPTGTFRCAFYLDGLAALREPDRIMSYDRAFLTASGGEHASFLELRGAEDLRIARDLFVDRPDMKSWMAARGIVFGREAHMTDDAWRFSPAGTLDALPLHEGKTFHQYTDRWKAPPRYAIRRDGLDGKPAWLRAARHYRLVFREIARSTDERSTIAAILPPDHLCGHKATCEKTPWARPDAAALALCAIFNSFVFDWCVRQKIAASLSLFMLNACPAPSLSEAALAFLARGAARLSFRPGAYDSLWQEQLGSHAPGPPDDPAGLRAALDAAVAHGYGLTRAGYAHVLSGFSHKSNAGAPALCLAAFEEYEERGEAGFFEAYDIRE